MSESEIYIHNSPQKEFIRKKWIEYANLIHSKTDEFGILTFPAKEMQDLYLFKEEGFIDREEVETKASDGTYNLKITKGKVRCFEKDINIQNYLRTKLTQAKVEGDISAYLRTNYGSITSKKDKTFPVDVVNLDFDKRLQPNTKYPFDETIEYIFKFQKNYTKNFSLFLTWPSTETEDIEEYKNLLVSTINANLTDPSASNFTSSFLKSIGSIDKLDYEKKSVIGISKIVIKKASQNLYVLNKNEFFVYGGESKDRKRMISLLFSFKYDGNTGTENTIYSQNVANALSRIIDINDEDKEQLLLNFQATHKPKHK